ncbi:MAG: WbqC family protein [Candidatus Hydrogenedentota bacterium]
MLVSIHQPHYLPWLRYFEKIARADVFILLDTVEFTKNGWQNRNKIKTPNGPALLTVPVHAHQDSILRDVTIDNRQPWRSKHRRTLEQSYGKAPYYGDHEAFLDDVYSQEWERLTDLNAFMLAHFLRALGIETPFVLASTLDVFGTGTERLINLIHAVGGTRYYSGAYALDTYLDAGLLHEAGIGLDLQEWHAPVYPQLHGEFESDLSIIDLLMNRGPDSLRVLMP